MRTRAHALKLVMVALGILLAGCGLSTNDEPERISSDTNSERSGDAVPNVGAEEIISLWMIQNEEDTSFLTSVRRSEAGVTNPDLRLAAEARLKALIATDPSAQEREQGITNAVPPTAILMNTALSGDVLTVSFNDSFFEVGGEIAPQLYAQVVYTATEVDGIDRVRFQRDGDDQEVVDGDGASRDDPLGKDDFESLRRPGQDED